MKQLNLFNIEKEDKAAGNILSNTIDDKPYRNGLGELLPWEEPEYLKNNKNANIGLV